MPTACLNTKALTLPLSLAKGEATHACHHVIPAPKITPKVLGNLNMTGCFVFMRWLVRTANQWPASQLRALLKNEVLLHVGSSAFTRLRGKTA
jgi:hypothetical protein